MKNLLFSALFLFVTTAQAEIVKVLTQNCATQKSLIQGSGILFKDRQSIYILSSEHATPSRKDLCFSFLHQNQNFKAELISSDWESGLSLLKVTQSQIQVTTQLSDFSNFDQIDQDVMISSGFPSDSNQILNDRARVMMSESLRSPFVSTPKLIEVMGEHVEFGMSGGALISQSTNKIVGLISHQRIVNKPGAASTIEFASQRNESNHILVIPSAAILNWFQKTLSGSSAAYSRSGTDIILGSGFKLKQIVSQPAILVVAKGGGDGVGVTGETDEVGVTIELALTDLNSLTLNETQSPETQWVKKLAAALLKKSTIKINRLIIFNSSTSTVEVVRIKSLTDFIQQMRSNSALPLLEANLTNEIGQDLSSLKQEIYEITEDSSLLDLQSKMQALIDAKIQYPNLKISVSQLRTLEQHSGWNVYFSESFEKAVKAKTFLEKLK